MEPLELLLRYAEVVQFAVHSVFGGDCAIVKGGEGGEAGEGEQECGVFGVVVGGTVFIYGGGEVGVSGDAEGG